MLEAAFWGMAAASSLVVGALLAFALDVSGRVQGLVLAFGAGVLDVLGRVRASSRMPSRRSRPRPCWRAGFALGALTFFVGSVCACSMERRRDAGRCALRAARCPPRRARQGSVDRAGCGARRIPELVVLGLSVLFGGINVPMLAAVFISNVPEALGASEDLEAGGVSRSPGHRALGHRLVDPRAGSRRRSAMSR